MTGPDVYGPGELEKLLGVSRQRIHQLRKDDPAFPEGTTLEIGTVYDGPTARAYDRDRREPKKKRAAAILKTYRRTGAVKTTARELELTHQTVRRYLREIGEPLPADVELRAGAGVSSR